MGRCGRVGREVRRRKEGIWGEWDVDGEVEGLDWGGGEGLGSMWGCHGGGSLGVAGLKSGVESGQGAREVGGSAARRSITMTGVCQWTRAAAVAPSTFGRIAIERADHVCVSGPFQIGLFFEAARADLAFSWASIWASGCSLGHAVIGCDETLAYSASRSRSV